MNVFIIPSWYPSEGMPIAGIFFKEQASYLAELIEDMKVGVSLWGQSDPQLAITKNPVASLKAVTTFASLHKRTKAVALSSNLYEFYTPALNWTHKLLNGNMGRILSANRRNLESFEEQFSKVDLIHAHVSYPAGHLARELAKEKKVPYIITEHMGPFPFPAFLSKEGRLYPYLSNALRDAAKVIAVSPALGKRIHAFGFEEPVFIPNVINEDFFSPGKAVSTAPFIFFTLAMLSPEKGIDDLLSAVAIVTKKCTDVCFQIGGGGKHLKAYKVKAKELGIDPYVNWLGELNRKQAREHYQNCNAFVLPSHGETFGVVYAEAIASGKPVVATRCGGPECIIDEKNGVLAEVKNPQDLAEKIQFLISNYSIYRAEEIRYGFESSFSKRAVIPKIVDVYKSVL